MRRPTDGFDLLAATGTDVPSSTAPASVTRGVDISAPPWGLPDHTATGPEPAAASSRECPADPGASASAGPAVQRHPGGRGTSVVADGAPAAAAVPQESPAHRGAAPAVRDTAGAAPSWAAASTSVSAASSDHVQAGPAVAGVRAPEIACRPARKPGAVWRGTADPVKSLMHRHRALCERAVDPLEIAAGLEAHGLTDRTAARYRHRDVFSLAEELYARMPASTRPAACHQEPVRDTEARARWALLALLPGASCLATAGVLRATEGVLSGGVRFAVTAVGALLVTLALRFFLRGGPLRAPDSSGVVTLYSCWLLGYAVYGEGLLAQVISGGPDGHWAADPAPLLGLALAIAPAAWCAHLFSVRAHHKLTGSRALEEFGAGVRPLLLGVVTLFLCALVALLVIAGLGYGGGASAGAVALGVLFFLARLLTVHGFPEPAATGLAAACAVEAAALCTVLAGRLPGLGLLARPVDAVVAAAGTGGVSAIACGAAALGLLLHAAVALSRASAHATV